jgi:hypothetical protein
MELKYAETSKADMSNGFQITDGEFSVHSAWEEL